MPEPVTMALIAATVAKGVGKILDHSGAKKRAATNRRLATAAAAIQTRQISLRELQERRSSIRTRQDLLTQGGDIQGLTKASAGAAGVGGSSVALLEADTERSTLRAAMDVQENYLITLDELRARRETVGLELESNLANNQGPSSAALGIDLAATAAEAAGSHYTFAARRGA